MAKYDIQKRDLYNFDEIDFIINIITFFMVVTRSKKYKKAKLVQPGNREWAIVIKYINATG